MTVAGKLLLSTLNIISFTCSGLGPVIFWEGVLLSPEGKGGGGGGGASPARDVL